MTENNEVLNQLNDLDSMSVEEIAENYSALDKVSEERIVAQCMRKTGISQGVTAEPDEEEVTGTEIYRPRRIRSVLAYVAVFAIVISGVSKALSMKNSPLVNSADMSEEIMVQESSTMTEVTVQAVQTEVKEGVYIAGQTVTAVSKAESTVNTMTAKKSGENIRSTETAEKTVQESNVNESKDENTNSVKSAETPPVNTQSSPQTEQGNSSSSPEIPANTESIEQKSDEQAETTHIQEPEPVVTAEIIVEQPVIIPPATKEPEVTNPVITKDDVLCFEDCVSTLYCTDGYETQYYYKFNGYSCGGTRYYLSRTNGLNFWYSIDGKKVTFGYADGTSKTAEILPDECGFSLKWENGDTEYFRLAYPNEFNTFLYGEDEDSLPLSD